LEGKGVAGLDIGAMTPEEIASSIPVRVVAAGRGKASGRARSGRDCAMDMNGSETIPASIETVWRALNDPDVLKQCIPGCEALEKTSDTEMTATVTLKVGPVKARFEGAIRLSNLNPPHAYTISGEGKGGMVGFAKGSADVTLTENGPDATVLAYTVKADVGGKIAQLGGRLIDSTARKLAEQFFSAFGAKASEKASAAPQP
jgi:carbon monoxide dehydrogenase subunit G